MPAQSFQKDLRFIGTSRGLGLALIEDYIKHCWHVVAIVRGNTTTGRHNLAEEFGGRLEIAAEDSRYVVQRSQNAVPHAPCGGRVC